MSNPCPGRLMPLAPADLIVGADVMFASHVRAAITLRNQMIATRMTVGRHPHGVTLPSGCPPSPPAEPYPDAIALARGSRTPRSRKRSNEPRAAGPISYEADDE